MRKIDVSKYISLCRIVGNQAEMYLSQEVRLSDGR